MKRNKTGRGKPVYRKKNSEDGGKISEKSSPKSAGCVFSEKKREESIREVISEEKSAEIISEDVEKYIDEDIVLWRIRLRTLAPVVLTAENQSTVMTETRDFFNGSLLRGVFATAYIREKNLGRNAQEDEIFRHLFFGGTRFVDALPLANGARAYFLPLSLMKNKQGTDAMDLLSGERPEPGYKQVKGLGQVKGGKLFTADVEKRVAFHMSRSSEKERLSGKSEDGNVYNYEALTEGQIFEGAVIGKGRDIDVLRKLLCGGKLSCRAGRSRGTEYGLCELWGAGVRKLPPVTAEGEEIFLRLETPLLFPHGTGFEARNILQKTVAGKIPGTIIEKIYVAAENVDRFVGVWGMRAPRQSALSAGSVFALRKPVGWTEKDKETLLDLLYGGAGARTSEGFGQLRLWTPVKNLEIADIADESVSAPQEFCDETVRLIKNILCRRAFETVRVRAWEDVKNKMGGLVGKTHALARLEELLGEKEDFRGVAKFKEHVKDAAEQSVGFKANLHELRLSGASLYDRLAGKSGADLYTDIPWKDVWPEELAEKGGLMKGEKLVDEDEIFYEYWLWIFRFGRKKAVSEGRNE